MANPKHLQLALSGEKNLRGFDLEGADLSGAKLKYARLIGANLEYASLEGADLFGAKLLGTSLKYARLIGARLLGAELEGANLSGADLGGANLLRVQLQDTSGNGKQIRNIPLIREANPYGWKIVYTKDILQIGCKNHTIKQWKNFSDKRIEEMDLLALPFCQHNKDSIFDYIDNNPAIA